MTHSLSAARLSVFSLMCGFCCWHATGTPATAQWFGKKFARKPAPAVAAVDQGFAGYIRRLSVEAQAAANRGDLESALVLAERAHKVSLTCQSMLANDPDCSPDAMESLVHRYRSMSDDPASAVAPERPGDGSLDLTPLLDQSAKEDSMPIPPTPAASRYRRMRSAATNSTQQIASRPRAGDPLAALGPKPKSKPEAVRPEPNTETIVLTADGAPRKFTRSTPSRKAEGYLVQQSLWLNPEMDAKELIDSTAKPHSSARSARRSQPAEPQPGRAVLESTPSRVPQREETPPAVNADEPEISVTLDEPDDAWQIDIEDAPAEPEPAPRERRNSIQPPVPREQIASGPSPGPESMLGIWVRSEQSAEPHRQLVGARSLIETDFRHVADGEALSDLEEPRTLNQPLESRPTLALTPGVPAVSCRENIAAVWPETSAPHELTAAKPASALAIPANRTLAIGIALMISGLVLFALSFRRT